MSMTVIVTRNVPDRYRGFLASATLEIAPGIYVSPKLNPAVRQRIWTVCLDWSMELPADGSVVMAWRDPKSPGGLGLEILGGPKAKLVEHDGLWLDHHPLTEAQRRQLERLGAELGSESLLEK